MIRSQKIFFPISNIWNKLPEPTGIGTLGNSQNTQNSYDAQIHLFLTFR